MKLCFNWKVLVGLAAVGLGVWLVAPDLIGAALPLLLLAACPLSMLVMMRGMQGGQCATSTQPDPSPAGPRLTRQEQLTELKTQLASLQNRQRAIAREIAELESPNAAAVHEAEAIAGDAERTQRPV